MMKFLQVTLLTALVVTTPLVAARYQETCATMEQDSVATEKVVVALTTSKGEIKLELDANRAPKTVENFLQYVRDGHFDETIFHRVIPNFMVQGGGMKEDMDEKPTRDPIANEAANGLKNDRGTIAMARTMDVNSATSQFFVNLVDNEFLNFRNESPSGFGYCVFGKVIEGMDVIDAIAAVKTGTRGYHRDVPTETVKITRSVVAE